MANLIRGWRMKGPGAIERFERPMEAPRQGRAWVSVAGCGVCHTDLGYLYGGVPTKRPNVVLGHEISGVVVEAAAGFESLVGSRVLVPAVAPCGACRSCKAGRPTSCRSSVMPGNDEDGGFATMVEVPAATLCRLDGTATLPLEAPLGPIGLGLWELSVVADAVATPFQAVQRSGLAAGELAVVVGTGGIGIFGVQIARATGAYVVAVDVDPIKLERAVRFGAAAGIDAKKGAKEVKGALKEIAQSMRAPSEGWRIFEMSGSPQGQELAWSLLTTGGSISVVGFTPQAVSVRLSNLMAFDATAFGNWGCDPALYPEAVARVISGAVQVRGLIHRESLDDAPAILEAAHHGKFAERVVLVP